MTKIIIQTGKYRGLYQIVTLQCKRFFIVKWWKAVSVTEHLEKEATLKLGELMQKYQLKSCDIYDWSGDDFYRHKIKNVVDKHLQLAEI